MIPCMRSRLLAVALVAALAAVVVVVAAAETSANGLPSYTNGYQQWTKLNRKPIVGGSPAHSGRKNVYTSKRRVGKRFPNGTVIVKSIAQPGDARARPSQVAVMRKTNGRWRFVEYELSGSRYTILAQGQLCVSCHMQVRSSDYVFTKR
jgi:Cytochrome P460